MPYTVAYRPSKKRPGRPWAKIAKRTGRITSRHKTKSKAKASIRAYYASRHAGNLACNYNGHDHSLALNARRNPLRKDPTRTTMIQRKFMSEIRKRFARLKAKVKEFLDTHDALGLKVTTTHIILHAQPREFQFRTDAGKLSAFNDFLRQQTEANLLSVPPGTPEGLPWTAGYIESAYKRGLLNAYLSSKEGQLFEAAGIGEQTQEQFLRSAFLAPEALSKVQLLATRSFEQLKGVSATMGSELNRILSQGMIDGSGPAAIAREIGDKIDSLSRSRAMTIARTEIVNAHAEGQLDAFDRLGVQELGIRAEWSTAGDDRVCPLCQELEGQVFDMEEARGMIPLHPNCVLGDSIVECPDGIALTRTRYSGKIIHFTTRAGRKVSVTENHVLLTLGGWRLAKDIHQGDQLIEAPSIHTPFVQDPNEDKGVTTISDIFQTCLEVFPEHFRSIPRALPQYFHGDGSLMHQKIDVVLADGKLGDQLAVPSFAEVKKFSLMPGDICAGQPLLLDGKRPLSFLLKRLASAADSFVSRLSIPAILARRPLTHHQLVSGRTSTNCDSGKLQSSPDRFPLTIERLGDFIQTLPFAVTTDEIAHIEISEPRRGGIFVFDVFTHSSIYALNGVLSSNCRCAWIPSTQDVKEAQK